MNPHLDNANDIINMAKEISALSKLFVIKVPCIPCGVEAVHKLESIGIRTNLTLVFSVSQTLYAAHAGSLFVSPFFARTAAFEIPYIIPDDRVAEAVYSDTELIEKARTDILSVQPSLRLMAIAASGGWRSFAATKKQIKQPSDLKGLKVRTVASKVQQDLVTSFGAAAMPYAEIYTSLSTCVVDGLKLSIVDIVAAKLDESLRYYILDNHSYLVGFWFINEQSFKEIPEDLRFVVTDGFEDLRIWLSAYPKYASIAAYDAFRAEGGEIIHPLLVNLKFLREHQNLLEKSLF